MKLGNVFLAILALATVALAQPPATVDGPFQVGYAANLNLGESFIDITNTGANGAPLLGPGFGGASGNICVNVYAFDPGEEMVSCCSCLVTPNQTVNLGVNRDLTVKTLTGVVPTSVTLEFLATLAGTGGTGASCIHSAATLNIDTPVSGMVVSVVNGKIQPLTNAQSCRLAGGIALVTFPGCWFSTQIAPLNASLSPYHRASLGDRCASILANGSVFGVCSSCQAGALGAAKQQ